MNGCATFAKKRSLSRKAFPAYILSAFPAFNRVAFLPSSVKLLLLLFTPSLPIDLKDSENHSCPLCKTEYTVPKEGLESLPTLYFTANILSDSFISSSNPLCALCDDRHFAAAFCKNCRQYQCDNCMKIHKKTRATVKHVHISILELFQSSTSRPSFCSEHTDMEISLFCQNCSSYICPTCITSHSGHQIFDLNQASSDPSFKIETSLAEV